MTDLLSVDIVDAISLTGFAAKWNKIGTTNGCFSATVGCFDAKFRQYPHSVQSSDILRSLSMFRFSEKSYAGSMFRTH